MSEQRESQDLVVVFGFRCLDGSGRNFADLESTAFALVTDVASPDWDSISAERPVAIVVALFMPRSLRQYGFGGSRGLDYRRLLRRSL